MVPSLFSLVRTRLYSALVRSATGCPRGRHLRLGQRWPPCRPSFPAPLPLPINSSRLQSPERYNPDTMIPATNAGTRLVCGGAECDVPSCGCGLGLRLRTRRGREASSRPLRGGPRGPGAARLRDAEPAGTIRGNQGFILKRLNPTSGGSQSQIRTRRSSLCVNAAPALGSAPRLRRNALDLTTGRGTTIRQEAGFSARIRWVSRRALTFLRMQKTTL